MTDNLTPEHLDELERLAHASAHVHTPHHPTSDAFFDEVTPEDVLALVAAARERDELAAFKAEWDEKDGNSPGYNLQKARSYGQQAYEWKQRAVAAEKERDELKARVAELEAKHGKLADAFLAKMAHGNPPVYTKGREDERRDVVAWLRDTSRNSAANAIERGEHVTDRQKPDKQ